MKTTITFIVALAVTLGLFISVPSAYAAKPLDVDCDLLADTNDVVFAFLAANNIEFDNLGDLVSSAILDEAVFEVLRDLILFFSGGVINFESASQVISTNAKCGLIPQLIDNITD